MITASDPDRDRRAHHLVSEALTPREKPTPTPGQKQLTDALVQIHCIARGAMMRARPIGSPNWCATPILRRPFAWPALVRLDSEGLYHPAYDTDRRYCATCSPKNAEWDGDPVDPAVVPRSVRCPENNPYWPNTVPRPWQGPLTRKWTNPGKVPRWYVWWRLHTVQDGRCATCSGPPQVIDHDHRTGLVRGLLCYECNLGEALCAKDIALHRHSGLCWFQSYWDNPPGAEFGWYWPDSRRQGGVQAFLPHAPTWAADQFPPPVTCSPHCLTWTMR
ncbi:endonuclease domain-containing protein [Streptomyces litmocidini]|uniref:endonuclease domain-containing protein n=1 Tax=Streptomyces litmocidini TaxID=67318 RepID=UPI0036FD481F